MTRSLILIGLLCASAGGAQEARLTVHADQVRHRLSRFLTGACLEDVNHECYGGLYSQMIFGESFQEPARALPPAGFQSFGGVWKVQGDELLADGGQGPKLIRQAPVFATGMVGVDMWLADRQAGNGGLIVRVRHAGNGADRFDGVEISLDANRSVLVLGRHRQDWKPLREVPCPVPTNRWINLVVKLEPQAIEVAVDGRTLLRFQDQEVPLASGRVGLRPWRRPVRYRNLWFATNGVVHPLPFVSPVEEESGVSGMWRAVRRGSAVGQYALAMHDVFVGRQSQQLSFISGEGEIGVANQGLNRWGMRFVRGKPYTGAVWVRTELATRIEVALEAGDGSAVYARQSLFLRGGSWQRLGFKLTPRQSDSRGRFVIALREPASVALGYASLEPGPWGRFKNLPVRRDIADALVRQGLTVLRYGGSMVNTPEYRWKNMIGPRDRRPPYQGTWYPYSSNGWGILDFLNFCEAAHFLGVPAFNMDETPGDMADFVEYVNGPPDSAWGRRRVADGHSRPYHLRYLELGNEEAVNGEYVRRFKPIMEAIWAKDPDIIPVVGDFAYARPIKDPYQFTGAPLIHSLAAHRQILELARQSGHPVWFDVHIGTDSPRDGQGLGGLPSFAAALGMIAPGASYKVVVFEFNAGHHDQGRALGNARAINELERIGPRVALACSANCLQPDGQNDNGWDQGLLFFNPTMVWAQPPYYVTQMASRNYLPLDVAAEVSSPGKVLDVTATRSEDRRKLALQVVNLEGRAVSTRIELDGFAPRRATGQVTELEGPLRRVNTAEHPDQITSHVHPWRHQFKAGIGYYTFPPYSYTILRFE
ncbi:MAG: hypothetical protein KGS61_11205 [Verrucomicrobia bacterium]|nr:hypothetical protein [Verrucomicrobiota bacterium]